jgi:LPXTG-site transpeptidase (sortase) family protein
MLLTYFALGLNRYMVFHGIRSLSKRTVSRSLPNKRVSGLPVRLEIPEIKVDASIEDMGLTSTGNMDVPADIADVGWYEYGPHPGNTGSAVIAGHLDGTQGQPGVFMNLNQLKLGDSLTTVDSEGYVTTFVVRAIQTYNQDERPSEVFHASTGIHLNLITCTGAWDTAQHRFTQRLVVFADKT